MHYRPFIQRLTPWLTAYLLVVSVGLPLQRVYCACVGEQWLTVLAGEHECHHESTATAIPEVHHHGKAKGCQEQAKGCHGTSAASDCVSHDCGNAEVLIAQLDVDFTFDAATADLGLALVLPPVAFTAWPPRPLVIATALIRGPSPPDLPSGRTLLVAHQTFLI